MALTSGENCSYLSSGSLWEPVICRFFVFMKTVSIKGYEGIYTITENGDVFSLRDNIYLKAHITKWGYKRIGLMRDKVKKQYLISRLVAENYIPNPKKLEVVNHIDCDKTNNNVSNLEWCTKSYNTSHAHKNGLIKRKDKRGKYLGVSWNSQRGKWIVSIVRDKKRYWFGQFEKEMDANKVAMNAMRILDQ